MAPSTPKPGSRCVSKRRGSAGADEVALGAADEVEEAVGVTVTLNTKGTTVLSGIKREPLEIVVAIVIEPVVRESEAEGDGD